VSGAIVVLVLAGIAVALRLLVFAPAPTAASGRDSTLIVQATREETSLGGEGFYSYFLVENSEGKTVQLIGQQGVASTPLSLQIAPGTYTIASYQRTCDAACPQQDPPFGRCAKTVTVGSDAVLNVVVSVRPYEGCTIASQP
jgi:hypothetical protein